MTEMQMDEPTKIKSPMSKVDQLIQLTDFLFFILLNFSSLCHPTFSFHNQLQRQAKSALKLLHLTLFERRSDVLRDRFLANRVNTRRTYVKVY